MTAPSINIPAAIVFSIITCVMGAYVAVETTTATLTTRMDSADKHIVSIESRITSAYVERTEFVMGLDGLKHELDEIRIDLRDIRRHQK